MLYMCGSIRIVHPKRLTAIILLSLTAFSVISVFVFSALRCICPA